MPSGSPTPESTPQKSPKRVICLLDVDSYEAQLYCRERPDFKDAPYIIVNNGGVILAINYVAKERGITRSMNRKSAVRALPGLNVVMVPNHPNWDKPNFRAKRRGTLQIRDTILKALKAAFPTVILEVSSCDEFYLDMTNEVAKCMAANPIPHYSKLPPKTSLETKDGKVIGKALTDRLIRTYDRDMLLNRFKNFRDEAALIYGTIIAHEVAKRVQNDLGFELSAGIGPNKILAKYAVPLNKPNGFAILPADGLARISKEIDLSAVPGLGGIRGKALKELFKISRMADLKNLKDDDWKKVFDAPGDEWLVEKLKRALEGDDGDAEVVPKLCEGGLRVGKIFRLEQNWVKTEKGLKKALLYLSQEMEERIFEEKSFNSRIATKFEIQVQPWGSPKAAFDISDLAKDISTQVDGGKYRNAPIYSKRAMEVLQIGLVLTPEICVKELCLRIVEFDGKAVERKVEGPTNKGSEVISDSKNKDPEIPLKEEPKVDKDDLEGKVEVTNGVVEDKIEVSKGGDGELEMQQLILQFIKSSLE